ncbi:DUF302 domain-containing protein [Paenisporosarcina quisquiliarum]|uniref:DUF302 domain-containing protein n=1 Tax=Paenisporosarcina quisquiliarum TaxID=365346 RepID=A0A9X3RF43_9BACL|nr:DUF302 domain-containing protein [Paenisporosarcina quisquiliarum]MCZ8538544.1 DUF302 domain-containing protein [Paenisporosarcina quisquiliarum]
MNFHYTVETDKSIDETVKALETTLKEEQFGVLWDFDLTAKLQEKGMDFDSPYRVLEVCNPKEADRVLKEDKVIGYFLPCKIVVYEDAGKTKIGLPKPTTLIDLANNEKLTEIATDVENRLIRSIDQAI